MQRSLPRTCVQTIVMASHCVGFTLPGMIDEPGSFSGKINSPKPQRGPEPNQRKSFAIFINAHANVFNAPLEKTNASCAASAANLLGADTKGNSVKRAIFSADFSANLGCAL